MKKTKTIITIIIMLLFWFSFDYLWHTNFKKFYELALNNKVLDIQHGRGGIKITIDRIKDNNLYIYCNNEEYLKISDSVSKKSKSDEIKIYRKSIDSLKWKYYKSIYIRKDLTFYSFIVKNHSPK